MNKVCDWVVLSGLVFVSMANAVADETLMQTDPLFGEPFKVRYIDTDSTGRFPSFHATLVSYPFGSSIAAEPASDTAKADSAKADTAKPGSVVPVAQPRASVLYIHGFNDYYIQREMAVKMDSAGYAFYAIDLHKYGRSYRKGERAGEVFDIAEYNAELDSAISLITANGTSDVPVVLMGHSTGALIALTYANAREKGKNFAAIVLNSPFLEMNQNFVERKVIIPLISMAGKYFPDVEVPRSRNTNYGESLHKDYRGEWDFNTDLKTMASIPVNAAWLRAIHKAHVTVQEPLQIQPPILVMHSGCSVDEEEWVDEYSRCDGVLNVEHIKKYGATLGPDVTDVEIQDGLHDLVLSRKPVRDSVYKAIFQFLGKNVPERH